MPILRNVSEPWKRRGGKNPSNPRRTNSGVKVILARACLKKCNPSWMMSKNSDERPFQGIIFDLDGTLLDTLQDIADSVNAALETYGFPGHRLEAYRSFVGDGVRALIERALPHGRKDEETITACARTYLAHYRQNWNRATKRYEGTDELLDGLTDMGMALAVLSNKPDDFTRSCVETFLHRWYFDPIVGLKEGIPRKPDPTGARRIIASFGIESDRILYLGDSGVDMQTALLAGLYPVGALWGFRTGEELTQAGARQLIPRPPDLLTIVDTSTMVYDPRTREP